ncbi:hypothetical protein DPMN_007109 [Dreissena polymorpha]|uniref:Uncharacterized protein n=1 Tax=Dreissena polymorpha TaxID=45954 RepID=A0A9D4MWP9_DREPO|nr:hypothetical protein DPMN_007109 [Dreissena polymorpha]
MLAMSTFCSVVKQDVLYQPSRVCPSDDTVPIKRESGLGAPRTIRPSKFGSRTERVNRVDTFRVKTFVQSKSLLNGKPVEKGSAQNQSRKEVHRTSRERKCTEPVEKGSAQNQSRKDVHRTSRERTCTEPVEKGSAQNQSRKEVHRTSRERKCTEPVEKGRARAYL